MDISKSEGVLAGQLRELGGVLFTFLAGLGFLTGYSIPALVSAFVAIVLVAYSIYIKASWRKVTSLIRKAFGAVGAILVASNYVDAGVMDSFNTMLTVAVPMLWSWIEKTATPEQTVKMLLVGFCVGVGGLFTSCNSQMLQGLNISGGAFIKDPVTGAKAGLKVSDHGVTGYARGAYIDEAGNVMGEWELETSRTVDAAKSGEQEALGTK